MWQAHVGGPPVSYGNKKALLHRSTGRVVLIEKRSATVRGWQDAMRESMRYDAPPEPLGCPVAIAIDILMQRPKGHRRRDGSLSKAGQSVPFPTRKPDADKVARAVGDSGTGIWYRDDSQITHWMIRKMWARGEECTKVRMMGAVEFAIAMETVFDVPPGS